MTSEDDDPTFGGPPPDPTERTWRHPSEIAAAEAAARQAAGARQPDAPRVFSLSSFMFGGTVGVAACLAIYALVWSGSTTTATDLAVFPTGPSIQPTSLTTVDSVASTTTPDPGSTDTAPPTTESADEPATPQRQPLPAYLEPVVEQQLVSIRPVNDTRPLGSGLYVDGLILCSAEALGDRDHATVSIAGRRYSATLAGSDPFTDIAVLVPDQQITESTDTTLIELDDPVDGGSITLLANDGQPEPIAVAGKVLSTGQRLTARSGHALLGAFETSARLPETGLGAVLVNDAGRPVGVVVSGEGYLASAIPISVAREVAANIISTGWASSAWLGIEGTDVSYGVEVSAIDSASPAESSEIEVGDVIRSLDGTTVFDMVSLVELLRERAAGDLVELVVQRDGARVTIPLTLADYKVASESPDDDRGEALSERAGD